MNRALIEYSPETEAFEGEASIPGPVDELDEMELAAGLLEAGDNAALGQFVPRLIATAARSAGKEMNAPTRQALAGMLHDVARQALPPRGSAPAASRGGSSGAERAGHMAHTAGDYFGLELEGLSAEDSEFELARGFVRFARDAVRHAAAGIPHAVSAEAAARAAVLTAARHYAPGLLRAPLLMRLRLRDAPQEPPPPAYFASPLSPSSTAGPAAVSQSAPFVSSTSRRQIMHDIDRTQMEYSSELPGFQAEQFEYGEYGEFGESEATAGTLGESVLSEADEIQLASELLAVNSEAELEQFLGSFIRKVGSVAGKVIRSPIGQAIGGVLKGVAKKALPLAGGALGAYIGGPLGAKIGSGLASAAGSALGLETEALEQEDREFEGAKQFVRVAADTVRRAAAAPAGADPRAVAQAAAVAAAKRFAPGLLGAAGPLAGAAALARGQRGTWLRRGNKIVLYGA